MLTISNNPVPWLNNNQSVKYLGVKLDRRLTWKNHIVDIANNTYAKLGKLYPLINKNSTLRIENGVTIYKSIIRPSLTYACSVWGGAANTHINKLEIIQNKFLRLITKAPWFIPNAQIQRELNISCIKAHINKLSKNFI